MTEYISTIIIATVSAGICGMLFDNKDGTGVGKYVRFAVSLCVLCALVLPVFKNMGNIDFSVREYRAEFDGQYGGISEKTDEYILQRAKENICEEIKESIFLKFGIMPVSCDIQFSVTEKGGSVAVIVDSAKITLKEENKDSSDAIRDYAETLLGEAVQIVLQ